MTSQRKISTSFSNRQAGGIVSGIHAERIFRIRRGGSEAGFTGSYPNSAQFLWTAWCFYAIFILHGAGVSLAAFLSVSYREAMTEKRKIAVVGLWHLGETYAACLAELGHEVVGIDADEGVITNLSRGVPPLAEPDISEMLAHNIAAGRLRFSADFEAVRGCDVVWMTFDTPVDEEDRADTAPIFAASEKILSHLSDGVFVIISSQVPVGTTEEIKNFIRKERPLLAFGIAHVPENLQLGRAVKSFFEPGSVVIGAEDEKTFDAIEKIFYPSTEGEGYPERSEAESKDYGSRPNAAASRRVIRPLHPKFLRMSIASAETAKHARNAFLATSLAFIYDIADLCEKTGADVTDVSRALRADPRIGQDAYLDASIGFSGGTLGRDLRALLKKAEDTGADLPVIASALAKNSSRRQMTRRVLQESMGDLAGKTIGIFGVAYKPGTSALRRSLALEIAKMLRDAGAAVRASDPEAKKEDVEKTGIAFFRDPYEAAEGCHALILITAWPEFSALDAEKIARIMKEPKLFFDARNFLKDKEEDFKKAGVAYRGVGRSAR